MSGIRFWDQWTICELTIHWDGKIMLDMEGESVDRLALLVFGEKSVKVLAAVLLNNGTGSAAATAVYWTR